MNLTHPELAEISSPSLPAASLSALYELRTQQCAATGSFSLQPQQKFLRRVMSPDSPARSLLMVHGTGVGKCHGRGTPILMYDGSKKLVEDIVTGDLLMGDDSTPRTVESLARGRDQMYRITSTKGESYDVNSEHILCLQHTSFRNVVTEISVREFLKLSNKTQRNLKGYRTAVDFPGRCIDVDPYILGVWLGDGSQRDPVITSQDAVILHYLRDFCQRNSSVLTYQSGYDYRISAVSRKHENVFLNFLKQNNLMNNKHVPDLYKINSREIRLQVIAGLIDTDGYMINNTYEIIQKSKQLTDDIVFIARSLGLATTTRVAEKSCIYKGERVSGEYYRTFISGDIDMIPVKLLRKKAAPRTQIKDVLRYGITVSPLGEGDYYGFMIDRNHRYVLGDFTVTHNTCTAIQVAEEYILRPEFQDKKVCVVASRAVQENFRTQIFDMSRVYLDTVSQTLSSKQCTGRRYLDMLLRIESEPKNWADPEIRSRLETTADKIIKEFYEFSAYNAFGSRLTEHMTGTEMDVDRKWVHDNFDNRLLIIDEAHNIREGGSAETDKAIAQGLEKLVNIADGLVLVFLTATPMFDSHEEIMFYMNLFNWNSRTQPARTRLKASDFFTPSADLKVEKEEEFRKWCQTYVSYVRGESPFTFPFRLPPPEIAPSDAEVSFLGKGIGENERLKYLSLVMSHAKGIQKEALTAETGKEDEEKRSAYMLPTVSVLPNKQTFKQTFVLNGKQYAYAKDPCLTPETLPNHSAKFVSVIHSIENSEGVVLVYSNFKTQGALLFAMALEEHGFTPYSGDSLMAKVSYSGSAKGRYIMLTSDASDAEISDMLAAVKNRDNRTGEKIRVIVTSPLVSEGVDFRYVRQVHILDPWWNMSRIEQVIGRALRTCSHQLLVPEEQNCTVYLHVIRADDDRESFDEYTYRTKVEPKGMRIAKVRKVIAESAMDCPIQQSLPSDWKNLVVPQVRSEGHEHVSYTLKSMMAPTFEESPDVEQCKVEPSVPDPDHVRPLSSYLDVRDELLTKIEKLFVDKAIWDRDQMIGSLKGYQRDVVIYTLQQAIATGFQFVDSFGRPSLLESKGDLYALAPIGVSNSTVVERTTKPKPHVPISLPEPAAEAPRVELKSDILDLKRESYKFPGNIRNRFSEDVLNGFVFDHDFTLAEKKAFLLTNPKLPFIQRLLIPDTDVIVLGPDSFLPEDVPMVGETLDKFTAWKKSLMEGFIENKTSIFGSVAKNGKFTLSTVELIDDVPKRISKNKRFEPTVCGTGDNQGPQIEALARYIDTNGIGVPKEISVHRCLYTELLAREQHNMVWYTPEEMSVLTSKEMSKQIIQALKSK